MEKLYTVGEAARLLNVAPRTVSKWFDSGALQGHRIPGSLHRRFTKENILSFIEEHDLPILDELMEEAIEELEADSTSPIPSNLPAKIRLLHSTLQTRLAYCSTDRDTITHLLQFRDNVMKAINDN